MTTEQLDIGDAYGILSKASGLKVGDKVKVTRKESEDGGNLGWNNSWVEEMDESVGDVFLIENINHHFGITLTDGSGCDFPFYVLEKVEESPEKSDGSESFESCVFNDDGSITITCDMASTTLSKQLVDYIESQLG